MEEMKEFLQCGHMTQKLGHMTYHQLQKRVVYSFQQGLVVHTLRGCNTTEDLGDSSYNVDGYEKGEDTLLNPSSGCNGVSLLLKHDWISPSFFTIIE